MTWGCEQLSGFMLQSNHRYSNVAENVILEIFAMTIKTIRVRNAAGAFKILDGFTKEYIGFRGHRNDAWRLGSTLARHQLTPPDWTTTWDIDEMIDHFIVQLKSIGLKFPFKEDDRRGRLEYARHYGVPSPLIDFSKSPYIALFFAFNGVRPHQAKKNEYAAIYCVNFLRLASIWSKQNLSDFHENHGNEYACHHNVFLFHSEQPFADGYPSGILKYFGEPAIWNQRMQKQFGIFLYDMLDYQSLGFRDLEHYLDQEEIEGSDLFNKAVLTKVLIPHKVGRDIFERLDILGVSATHLFGNPEGAAYDVINAYSYGRKTGWAWDVRTPRGNSP